MTHKNLSHLTEQQIKELINRYYNNEKVADLLKEFDINSSANVLVSLFPPIIHCELFCKYCQDINLVSKLESRSYNLVNFNPICPVCNHNDKPYCSCRNCQEVIYRQRQVEEEHKRRILMNAFLYKNIKVPFIEELTLKDALYLLSVISHSAPEDLKFVKPYSERPSILKLAPDEDLIVDIINHLSHRGFILINPSINDICAFQFNAEQQVVGYYKNKILWELLPNMNAQEKQQYLYSVINIVKGVWSSAWKSDIIETWQQIAIYECMEHFKDLLVKHKFVTDEDPRKKILATFTDLLKNLSVGQIFNLSWQAVRDMKYYISLQNSSCFQGKNIFIESNVFISKIHNKAAKVISKNWTIKNSQREFCFPQTILSSTFFNTFLELGNEYYENVMPVDYKR
ncbi:MAG: hypothetical protein LN573_04010 [Rickettsia endosymbiont of Oxypoda opaca]|nr:hypothetical protein [Rickettsia endosymbiont of Oxypoda opaca]